MCHLYITTSKRGRSEVELIMERVMSINDTP